MITFKRALTALCLLAFGFSPLQAEPATVLMSEFEAFSDAQSDGRRACSIRIRAGVKRLDETVVVVNGTLNNFYHPNRLPTLVIKFAAAAVKDQTAERIPITYALVRIGQIDTRPFVQQNAADGLSRLLVLQDQSLVERYNTFLSDSRRGMWITLEVEQPGITFQLPGFEKESAWKQFAECEVNALNNLRQSLDDNQD